MPGFVDVSNMSDLEIKRLGQRDDDFGEVDAPRRGRYGATPASVKYFVDDVWAAAVLATDVNGGYCKEYQYEFPENAPARLVKKRNRDLVQEYLTQPNMITAELIERGRQVQEFLRNDLTFRALKGKLTDFDQGVSRVLAVSGSFDTVQHRYEMAIVASLPASVARSQQRQTADERVQFAQGGLIGAVGDKVTAQVEVLSAVYSQNYNCWFIKGITDRDQPVFFSFKQKHDAGTWLTVQGTVKAHRDNLTQLNRVKVL